MMVIGLLLCYNYDARKDQSVYSVRSGDTVDIKAPTN